MISSFVPLKLKLKLSEFENSTSAGVPGCRRLLVGHSLIISDDFVEEQDEVKLVLAL